MNSKLSTSLSNSKTFLTNGILLNTQKHIKIKKRIIYDSGNGNGIIFYYNIFLYPSFPRKSLIEAIEMALHSSTQDQSALA